MRQSHARWAIIAATFSYWRQMTCRTTRSVSKAPRLAPPLKVGHPPSQGRATKMDGRKRSDCTVKIDRAEAIRSRHLSTASKNDSSIKDGFVEAKFKAIAGSQDRAAGIVWRAKRREQLICTPGQRA